MNGRREDNPSSCYFHPEEELIGVCPFCLHERLLILASWQKQHRSLRKDPGVGHVRSQNFTNSSNPRPPKIFALRSLLSRLEFRHYWKSDGVDLDREASISPEDDSFISIKFEDNGATSWEKQKKNTAAADTTKSNISTDTVLEHVSRPQAGSLKWRRRIGYLFHLIKWKKSSKASVCHAGARVEGVKGRYTGWIRMITKRKAKQ